jgi:hypothetical protein
MLQAFIQNISSVPDLCCKCFDLDVTYISHICCNSIFQIFHLFDLLLQQMFLCCKLQVFYLDVAYFHTYVTSLCYRCFIYFRHMLHSSVSCCLESQGERGVMVARHGCWGMGRVSRWLADVVRSALGTGGRGEFFYLPFSKNNF